MTVMFDPKLLLLLERLRLRALEARRIDDAAFQFAAADALDYLGARIDDAWDRWEAIEEADRLMAQRTNLPHAPDSRGVSERDEG